MNTEITSITYHLREAIGTYLAGCDEDDVDADDAKSLLLLALDADAPAGADGWSAEYTDDAWHLVEPGWHADDGVADLHCGTAQSAAAAAAEYVSGGYEDDDSHRTSWVHISTWRRSVTIDRAGDVDEAKLGVVYHTVEIGPTEPDCAGGHEHEWTSPFEVVGGIRENPGCWGYGGGVIQHEVCPHCGLTRITDTWAQDPSTGEQGLTSVEYVDDPDHRSALERLTVKEARRRGEEWARQFGPERAPETLTLGATDWNAIREAGHGGILNEELCGIAAQSAYDEALGR